MNLLKLVFYIVIYIGFLSFLLQIGIPFIYILLLITLILMFRIYWIKNILKNPNFKYKIPKVLYQRYFTSNRERIEYANYLRECLIRRVRYFVITSQNKEMILPSLNISEEDKKQIVDEVQNGNEVIVSEKAYEPDWASERRYIVIKKSSPKVKFKVGRYKFFPGMNFKEFLKFSSYFSRYEKAYAHLEFPIVWVSKDNYKELLPELEIPVTEKKKIEDKVKDNKIVVVSEVAYKVEGRHWPEKFLTIGSSKKSILSNILTESIIYIFVILLSVLFSAVPMLFVLNTFPSQVYIGSNSLILWILVIVSSCCTYFIVRWAIHKKIVTSLKLTVFPVLISLFSWGLVFLSIFIFVRKADQYVSFLEPISVIVALFVPLFAVAIITKKFFFKRDLDE